MPSAADLFPRTATPRHGVQGVVQAAPADTDTLLSVDWDIDSDDGAETVGEPRVRWASNGRLPAVGDVAILFTDGQGNTWAFVWATGAVLSATPAAVAAMDSRLDVLEAAAASEARGQATVIGTGLSFADVIVTDNLGTAAKLGNVTDHAGGTYVIDRIVCAVISTTTNTTTLRAITRLGGNIGVGATVLIDYRIWK